MQFQNELTPISVVDSNPQIVEPKNCEVMNLRGWMAYSKRRSASSSDTHLHHSGIQRSRVLFNRNWGLRHTHIFHLLSCHFWHWLWHHIPFKKECVCEKSLCGFIKLLLVLSMLFCELPQFLYL